MIWFAVLGTSVGCYLQKILGLSIPQRYLAAPRIQTVVGVIPIALLSALTAVQVFGHGQSLVVDARAAGLVFAFVALLLRAPFVVVVVGAAAVAAGLRAMGAGA